ncbi:MAG: hypothetical protein ACT4NY_18125 [Pseudonocardiales bacterium]
MTRHALHQVATAETPMRNHRPDDGLQGFRTDGYAVLRQRITGNALEALRTEADGLIRRFTQDGFRSDDYWYFTPAETAVDRWGHGTIARRYLEVYKRAVNGEVWT